MSASSDAEMQRINSMTWRGTTLLSVIVALSLLIASGLGYRVLASKLQSVQGNIVIPRGTLNDFPMQIGEWQGREAPLTEAVVKATDTDDHLSRRYQRGPQCVSLFVAFGVRMRDLAPHRPEVCYPASGWTLEKTRQVEIPLDEGAVLVLPCQVHRFYRGGIDPAWMTVLNYYIVDGAYCPDVSLLRSKSWKPSASIGYAAQVQIASSTGVLGSEGEAENSVLDFAAVAAQPIRAKLLEAVQSVTKGTAPQEE